MGHTTREMAQQKRAEKKAARQAGAPPAPGAPGLDEAPAPKPRASLTGNMPAREVYGPFAGASTVESFAEAIRMFSPNLLTTAVATLIGVVGIAGAGGLAANSQKVKGDTRYLWAALASVLWLIPAVALNLHGDWAVAEWALPYAGSVVYAAPGWHQASRRKPVAAAPKPLALEAAPPAVPQPPPVEQAQFQEAFCRTGPFAGSVISDFTYIDQHGQRVGFKFKMFIPHTAPGSVSSLGGQVLSIAKLFHTNSASVHVGYDETVGYDKSEAHAEVMVSRAQPVTEQAKTAHDPGASTWDPLTGAFIVGDYDDGVPVWWELLRPEFGPVGGIVSGSPGYGKTTVLNGIFTQSGLAVAADGRRLAHLFIGDPQIAALPVWKGRATLTGSGRLATLHMLRIAVAIGRSRAHWLGTNQTLDALGRPWDGQGSAVISPNWPLILVGVDEIPMMTNRADFGDENVDEVISLLGIIIREFRKVGIIPVLATQTPEMKVFGHDQAIRYILMQANILAVRSAKASTELIGIKVDPVTLPNDFGWALSTGRLNRPDARLRTRWFKEDNSEMNVARQLQGLSYIPDLRDVAEAIAAMPVVFDPAMRRAMEEFGWDGREHWVLTDDDVPDAGQYRNGAPAEPAPAPATEADGMPPVQEVLDKLLYNGPMTRSDIKDATRLPYGQILAAVAILVQQGQVADLGDGRYAVGERPAA